MSPKAYRWVHEMLEIENIVQEDGNFQHDLFYGVGEVYRAVAEDSDLGFRSRERGSEARL